MAWHGSVDVHAWVGCGLFTTKETFAASDNNDSHATIPGCFLQLFQKHGYQLLGEGVALGWPVKGEYSDSINWSRSNDQFVTHCVEQKV